MPRRGHVRVIYGGNFARRLPQPHDIGFERSNAFVALGERAGDVGRFKTLGDMLRTIGVPSRNREEDRPLGARLVQTTGRRLIVLL